MIYIYMYICIQRLNRITNESGFIEKDAFLNFAKR